MRKLHVAISLFLLPFLLAFAISAADFAHQKWFPHPHRTRVEARKLTPGITDARVLAREWPGEIDEIETPAGYLKFRVMTPLGGATDVSYSIATGETVIQTTTVSVLTSFAFLHISHGVWQYVTPVVSAGLLTVGITGLLLWFKNRRERRVGFALLVIGAGIPIALIISMRQ